MNSINLLINYQLCNNCYLMRKRKNFLVVHDPLVSSKELTGHEKIYNYKCKNYP